LISRFVRRHRVGVAAAAAVAFAVIAGGITSTALYFKAERNRVAAEQGREKLRKSYSRSDQQMARQFIENGEYNDAVAFLTRSLRTDPENSLASTNLLSLLANVHLIRPDTPLLELPEGAQEAMKTAVSREAGVALALCRILPPGAHADSGTAPRRETICTWDLKTGERRDHPMPPNSMTTCLEITPDGSAAVIARDDGTVELWSLKDGKRRSLQPRLPTIATCITFSGKGYKLLAGSEIDETGRGSIHVWDLREPQEPARVMKQKGVVSEIAVDYDGVFAVSAFGGDPINPSGDDGAATVWDLRNGEQIGDPIEVEKGLLHVAIEPRQELVALGMNNGTVFVGGFRNVNDDAPPLTLSHTSSITALHFSSDGHTLVVGDGGGYVNFWNVATGRLRYPPLQHEGEILFSRPAAESSLVTAVSRQGNVTVFDVNTGGRIGGRIGLTLRDARVTRDGSLLAIAPRGMPGVQVWDVHERMSDRKFVDVLQKNLITRIKGPDNSPQQLRYSEAGGVNRNKTRYAAADPDGTVFVYDAKTLKPVGKPFYHPPAVGAVTLTNDEKLLITSGRDREVRIWDIETRRNILSLRHDSYVPVLALSPDDESLVTVTDEGEMRVWNIRTGDCLTPPIHNTPRENDQEEGIVVARVSEDGKSVLFRVSGHGFFSATMPPLNTTLPEWFLKLAEGLARRRITDTGRTEVLSIEDFETAVAAIPNKPAKEEETAARWAHWLLAAAATRPLSPLEDRPFDEYLRALKNNGSPAAARELLRYRPADKEAAELARKLVPSAPE
jgi:WD40 repeat protein